MNFIRIFLAYILGYIRISVEGYYIERFINICNSRNLLIWNIRRKDNISMELNSTLNNFKELTKISKQTKCKIKIKKKKGIPFVLNRYRKRKIFGILLIIFLTLIVISSNYIWNIDIKVYEGKEIENIEMELEKAGLSIGKNKFKIDTKKIINEIRLNRDDISWIGIEIKGTNAIVKIVKADKKTEILNEDDYSNIISVKDAIITKVIAQNGTAKVKDGDFVKKGEILIEGTMSGKYTGTRFVHSIGEVEGKVWYTETEKFYYSVSENIKTGNKENIYKIKFLNFEINFNKTLSKFKIYDTIETEKKFKLFSNFYLPISVIKITNNEQCNINVKYTNEQAKNIGIDTLRRNVRNKIKEKEKIVKELVDTKETDEYVEVTITYEVLENIGTDEKIQF